MHDVRGDGKRFYTDLEDMIMDKQKIDEAKQHLEEWLSDPREFGKKPAKIEYVKDFTDEDGVECMIFKFKKSLISKWIIGIAGEMGVFSAMREYNEATAEKDAAECLDWLKNYWKRVAAEQSGEGMDEYKDSTGRFIASVLLSDRKWDRDRLRQDLKEDWGIEPSCDENDENEADGESQEDGEYDDQGTDIFEVGKATVVLALMDMPVPDGEAEHDAALNYMWQEAVEVTKTHQAHIIVTILGKHENPMEDGVLFVKILSSLCKQENVIGVYTNAVVYQPKFYFAMGEMIRSDIFPILGLIWFGVLRTEKGFCVYTTGMNSFGKDDMEILDADEDPNELKDFMMGMAEYCIEGDVVLHDGESIGISADHRCQISRSEGVCTDGMTLKIAYHKE